MVGIVPSPVTSSGSSGHGYRTARPSTIPPQPGRPCPLSHWALQRAWDCRDTASRGALPSRPWRGSRDQRSRLAEAFAPTRQRLAGRRRSAGLRSRLSPPPASGRRDTTLCRPRAGQLHGATSGLPAYRAGAQTCPLRPRPSPPRTYKGRTIAATPPDRQETWQLRLGQLPSHSTPPFGQFGLRRCAAGGADLQHRADS